MIEDSTSLIERPEVHGPGPVNRPGPFQALAGAAIALISWQALFYLAYPLTQTFGYSSAAAISYILLAFRVLLVLGGYFLAARKKILVLPAIVLVGLGLGLANIATVRGIPLSYTASYTAIGTLGPALLYVCITLFYFTSWLVLRGRPARSYLAATPVAGVAFGMALLGNLSNGITWALPPYAGPVIAVVCVGCAWLAVALEPKREVPVRTPQTLQSHTVNPPLTTPGQTNGLAIAALIVVFFNSIIGLILGHVALSQIKRSGQAGHGLALAAVVIGWITTAVAIIAVVTYFIILGTSAAHYR